MNQALLNIMTRRSVRSFADKKIPLSDLEAIAAAAVAAPSANNRQTWHFSVIQNKPILKKLAEEVKNAIGADPDYSFYNCDALIIASGDRSSKYAREDCSCALENIFLAANALGIGSVWINQLRDICGRQEIRKILTEAGIPATYDVIGAAALGYAASDGAGPQKSKACISYLL